MSGPPSKPTDQALSLSGGSVLTRSPLGGRTARPRLGLGPAVAGLGVVLMFVAALSTDGFLSVANAQAILLSVAVTGLLAVGLTFVTVSGNLFSLSLGATVLGAAALCLASLRFGVVAAIAIPAVAGAVAGVAQGAVVGGLRANPIMTTLAASSLITGVALGLTKGEAVLPPADAPSLGWLADTNVLDMPISALLVAAIAAVAQSILTWTRFGRELLLTGANAEAARADGLRVGRIAVVAFGLSGCCAALGGVLVAASSGQATIGFANNYDFDAITAVVLGGALITGGRGAVWRSVLATLLLGVLSNVLLLRGVGFNDQLLVKGAILITVIAFIGARRLERER